MRYDDHIVDQVQNLNDIVEIVSGYIPLKKAGRTYKACCPFHQEKTPSFIVNAERQTFHCFGCSVGGDVFSFVMKYENITFPEALRMLAERARVTLPEPTRGQNQADSVSAKLYEIYEAAYQYYRANFEDRAKGKPARDYMEKRGYKLEDLADFGIGYALSDWGGLFEFLSKKGFQQELLLRSGLVLRSSKGTLYDLFRARVMFPIRNAQGKVIAVGGRNMTNELPKYINSPETEIFRKRREFYGLHLAKRFIPQDEPRMFVVEGYLDQMRLAVSGFKNSVATLGTALTEEHVKILKRYVKEAVLVYDGDRAGESAALRGIGIFLQEGLLVKILSLPAGMDPDDVLRTQGPAAFQKLVDEAQDIFDFKLNVLLKKHNRRDSLGLLKITSELLETFAQVQNAMLLDRYINKLAVTLGVNEDSIRRELGKMKTKIEAQPEKPAEPAALQAYEQGEFGLLSMAMEDGQVLGRVLEEVAAEDFENEGARQIFLLIRDIDGKGEKVTYASVCNRLQNETLKSLVSRVSFIDLDEESRRRAADDCIRRVKEKKIKKHMSDLQLKIRQAEERGREEEVLQYMKEFQSLMMQIKN